ASTCAATSSPCSATACTPRSRRFPTYRWRARGSARSSSSTPMRDPRAESSDPPVADSRGRRLWPLALLAIGILACVLSVLVARGRDGLSNSDEAAYAEQADAILDGRPLTVGFVRHFHVRHPPDIVHPEDFYPPGNGALLALSWALFGR